MRTSAEDPSEPVRWADAAFTVLEPPEGAEQPIVAHVPHAGTILPPDVRTHILLDDAGLDRQLVQLTDWHTDSLFDWLTEAGARGFVNRLSRLVVDPERFADDDREPMAALGQGVVYTRTTDGDPLRAVDPVERARLVRIWYDPYHEALTRLVDLVLERVGRCLIIDGHSFATDPLPSERDRAPDRPDVCIGTDPTHTPERLALALESAFRESGFRVKRDSPFAGALVPSKHHGRDLRVTSVMIEVRRGLYCDETTGAPLPWLGDVRDAIRSAMLGGLGTAGIIPPRVIGSPDLRPG